MQRQLWWNFRPQAEEERAQYFFVIINDSREIATISTRAIEQLAPVDELQERDGKAGDLMYKLMVFFSPRKLEPWQLRKIYDGNVKRDHRLYERERTGVDGLEAYIMDAVRRQGK